MTLTVRLPDPLEEALDQYSAAHGLTKSHVVQEALAAYLAQTKPVQDQDVSETYRALKKAGLLGCVRGDGVSATKEVVRKRALERLKSRR
jgi:predicted DNA-binding protein